MLPALYRARTVSRPAEVIRAIRERPAGSALQTPSARTRCPRRRPPHRAMGQKPRASLGHHEFMAGRIATRTAPLLRQVGKGRSGRDGAQVVADGRVVHPPADAALQAVTGFDVEKGRKEEPSKCIPPAYTGSAIMSRYSRRRSTESLKSSRPRPALLPACRRSRGIQDQRVHTVEVLHPPDILQLRAGDAPEGGGGKLVAGVETMIRCFPAK